MLYRIFSPKFMQSALVLVVVEVVGVCVGLVGVRTSRLSVGEVFGFGEFFDGRRVAEKERREDR